MMFGIKSNKSASATSHPPRKARALEVEGKPKTLSLCDRLCGVPSDREFFDPASVTTTEEKYRVHPKIAEFW
jgi:hypothetical protein